MAFTSLPKQQEWQQACGPVFTWPPLYVIKIGRLLAEYPGGPPNSKAKENQLLEIRQLIDQGRDLLSKISDRSQRAPKLQLLHDLDRVVQELLKSSFRSAYREVACIGFLVKTGDAGYYTVPPSGPRPIGPQKDDLWQRCDIMAEVIELAYTTWTGTLKAKGSGFASAHRGGEADGRILKIFMAPEFFFRPSGDAGYDEDQLSRILPYIRQTTGQAKFADWLFVLGTCLGVAKKTTMTGPTKKSLTDPNPTETEQGTILTNFALVQKGGFPGPDGLHDLFVEKEFPSHVDFKMPGGKSGVDWYQPDRQAVVGGQSTAALTSGSGRVDTIYSDKVDAQRQKDAVNEMVAGGCIFRMDGITFGLEVCRDHYQRRLAYAKDNAGVQIHLLPSCGAAITAEGALPRALVFNVDGGPHAQLKRPGKAVKAPPDHRAKVPLGPRVSAQLFNPTPQPELVICEKVPIP